MIRDLGDEQKNKEWQQYAAAMAAAYANALLYAISPGIDVYKGIEAAPWKVLWTDYGKLEIEDIYQKNQHNGGPSTKCCVRA